MRHSRIGLQRVELGLVGLASVNRLLCGVVDPQDDASVLEAWVEQVWIAQSIQEVRPGIGEVVVQQLAELKIDDRYILDSDAAIVV